MGKYDVMRRKLGVLESAQTISGEYAPFNAVGVVSLMNGPSPGRVREILKLLQDRHPLLKMRILKTKNFYTFEQDAASEIPHRVINRENDDHWRSVSEQELNRNFDVTRGPLLRCSQLHPGEPSSGSEIILTCHHSIIDASSVYQMFHELLSMAQSTSVNSHGSDDSPLSLIPPEENFFPSSYKGFSGKWRIFLFMLRQIGDEIRFQRRIRGKVKTLVVDQSLCRILPLQLSEDTTKTLIQKCRRKRVSLNSYLSAAMLIAVAKLNYEDQDVPARHVTFADLRPYLKPPVSREHIGSYHSLMRMTFYVKKRQPFWDLAQQINQAVYTAAKRGDKFISPLMSAKMMRMYIGSQKMRMGTTALSFPGVVPLKTRYGDIQVRAVNGFVSNFPIGPEYTATARIFDQRLCLDFVYLDTDMSPERAQAIAGKIMAIIQDPG